MNDMSDKVRRGRKFDQVLAGAREVFLADGFEGASVDDIARVAGVSKATLYSYFPDKRLLFMEVARQQCALQADIALQAVDHDQPPAVVLRQFARHFLDFLLSDFGLSIFRICVAEADRFPDLGREFYTSGPELVRDIIVGYLRRAAARNELNIDDFNLAADQLAEMCKADIWLQALCGIKSGTSRAERDRVIDAAVDTFLARYGA